MRKRLFLAGVVTTAFLSPVFAQEDTSVVPLNNNNDSQQDVANNTESVSDISSMHCDNSTLHTYSGRVGMRALWELVVVSCGSGEYFNKETAECAVCLENNYCPGGDNFSVEQDDVGLNSCPAAYPFADSHAETKNSCYKKDSIACNVKKPYIYGHGTPIYENEYYTCNTHFGADTDCTFVPTDACDYTLNCDAGYEIQTVAGEQRCVVAKIICDAGTYLPAGEGVCATCPADSFCIGGDFYVSAENQGIDACENGTKSPAGSVAVTDCGRILRIGDNKLYLHTDSEHRTSPSLVVDVDGNRYYADITPVSEGVKPVSADNQDESLHVVIDGIEYTIHTRIHGE